MTELLLLFLLLLCRPGAASSSSSKYHHHCDWCPRPSTASISLFPPNKVVVNEDEVVPDGAHYYLAAASADLLRDGGACYQLRCADQSLFCAEDGVNVVVVAEKPNIINGTGSGGFELSRDAFSAMMMMDRRNGGGSMSDKHLAAAGLPTSSLDNSNNLQVQFRRIPCEYKKNLAIRAEDQASQHHHLAIRFLYQGGLTDIAAVEVAQRLQVGSTPATALSWRSMVRHRRRKQLHGGQVVWRTARAPEDGPLQLRFVVTAGSGGKWLRATLPADWRPGRVYDTGLQVTDVAVGACTSSCGLAGDDDDNVDELR